MSTIIMGMLIPNKPTKNVLNLAKKYPKKQTATSQTGWRRSCSLKLTADHPSDRIQSKRRSGNYKPTLWDFDRIQSLTSVYTVRMCPHAFYIKTSLNILCFTFDVGQICWSIFFYNSFINIFSNEEDKTFFIFTFYIIYYFYIYFCHNSFSKKNL